MSNSVRIAGSKAADGRLPRLEIRLATRPAAAKPAHWKIVIGAGASVVEWTAARELRDYLNRVTGSWHDILTEDRELLPGPALREDPRSG